MLAPKHRIIILKLPIMIIIILIMIIIVIIIIIIIIINNNNNNNNTGSATTRLPSKFTGSYRCIFRKYGLGCNDKWYDHQPQPVAENREVRITWDMTI